MLYSGIPDVVVIKPVAYFTGNRQSLQGQSPREKVAFLGGKIDKRKPSEIIVAGKREKRRLQAAKSWGGAF